MSIIILKRIISGLVLWGISGTICLPAQKFLSVLITEVMADPTPAVGLPAHEYVELTNRSDSLISLRGWTWQVSDKSVVFQTGSLTPGESVLLVPAAARGTFAAATVDMDKWLVLPNAGAYLVLKNADGRIVHFMEYSPALYTDALDASGGVSLELQSAMNPCRLSAWLPSTHPEGGTPGHFHPADTLVTELITFQPLGTGYVSDQEGFIRLSDFLRPDTPYEMLRLTVAGQAVSAWDFYGDRPDMLWFRIAADWSGSWPATVKLSGELWSCSGQLLQPADLQWGLPAVPDSGHLRVSEIMFDPLPGASEWVELYNASDRIIDLRQLILAKAAENWVIQDFSDGGSGSVLLFPGEYGVLCADVLSMLLTYPGMPAGRIQQRHDWPVLNNSGGRLLLLNQQRKTTDRVVYDPDWHYPLHADVRGISLERIALEGPGWLAASWFSASLTEQGATPGRQNSQLAQPPESTEEMLWLETEVIHPCDPEYPQQARVHLSFPEPGCTGECLVLRTDGTLVKEVFSRGLLPVQGVVTWDGSDQNDRAVPEGIYVIIFRYALPNGRSRWWKRAVGVRTY